jgi:hypothetical protein
MELKECKVVNTSMAGEPEYHAFQRTDDLKVILFNEVVGVVQNEVRRNFNAVDDVLYIRKHMGAQCYMTEYDGELIIYLD